MSSKGHVHFNDKSSQAALFETMILAAGADGTVTRVELEEIYRRVFERPEFKGIQSADLRQALEHAAQQVAHARDLLDHVPSLAKRLPDRAHRELAFGLAAAVATADHSATPPELAVLKALQEAFGLGDDDVARLFELAEYKAPLPKTGA
jgi:uncharacterized tellurite resistance protein B-like protein